MPVIPYIRATHSDGQSWSAAKANLLEAGVNDVSYAPAVRVTHNAAQTATTGAELTVAFNTERFDQAGNAADTQHDNSTNNSRLTCRYAGVYWIQGQLEWASNVTGFRTIRLRLNGATEIAKEMESAAAAAVTLAQQVSCIYALAVNDYVELLAIQNSGGNLNVTQVSNSSPEFMMCRIG